MKLLVITQAVDIHSTTLGFFHRWLEEFSERFESISVICLQEGEHNLPKNVHVHSLGKEKGNSRLQYITTFFTYIWKYRNEYETVFVHMNQEYIVLGGWLWKLLGKRIFFWRNHPYGNMWTRIAVCLSNQVFCTADKSFTARYKKTALMPAGVDTKIFTDDTLVQKEKGSLLVFGRIAPVKRVEMALDTTARLLAEGLSVELSVVGDALPRDQNYVEDLKKRASQARLEAHMHFVRGVDFLQVAGTYQSHEAYLNFTESGSFDKTVIEALACGAKVLVSNTSLKDLLPEGSYTTGEIDDSVEKLRALLSLTPEEEMVYHAKAKEVVEEQSLSVLMNQLSHYIYADKK
jgi:glycosyltransferase involved in cell wall biosynthesis